MPTDPRRRPGYLPGTPDWHLRFILAEVLGERPTGRPSHHRRGPKPLPGVPDRPQRPERPR